MSPASRSQAGSNTWLRLRSIRNSGGPSPRRRPDDGLDLIGLHSEFGGDGVSTLPSPKSIQDVLNPNLLPCQDGLAEGEPRIDDDVCSLVSLQLQARWILVCVPGHELQVAIDDLVDRELVVYCPRPLRRIMRTGHVNEQTHSVSRHSLSGEGVFVVRRCPQAAY